MKIESPEINLHIYGRLIFEKGAKVIQWGILLLGICPRDMNTYVHTEICTWIYRQTLFILAKI